MRNTQKLFTVAALSLAAGLFCIGYGLLNVYYYLVDKTWINIVWTFLFLTLAVILLLLFRWATEKIDFIRKQTSA